MYTLDSIKEEVKHNSKWWVFPDGFHANQADYPDKRDALKVYIIILEHDLSIWKHLLNSNS